MQHCNQTNSLKKRLLTAAFFWVLFSVQAQQVVFNPVSAPEGSSWGQTIGAITQDKQGYIWLATFVGLHRYDGYHLHSFTHDPSNKNSIASNQVRTLYTDRKGNIWVGTNGDGLDKLDPLTGIFTHYKSVVNDPATLDDNRIRIITEDSGGTMWIGTDKGLNNMDPKTGKVVRYVYNPNNAASISNGPVTALYEDRSGTLWVGTARGISLDEPCYGGLNKLDRKSGTFIHYQHDPLKPNSLLDDRVTALFEDSAGNFWVGTSGHGVHLMDRQKGTFERIPYSTFNANNQNTLAPAHKNYIYEYITFITQDVTGALWLGTFGKGVFRYDAAAKKSMHYELDTLSGFVDASGWRVYNSREGILWISTIQGSLYRVNPLRKFLPFTPTPFPVAAMYEDTFGQLWMGNAKGQGLLQVDRKKGTTRYYASDSLNPRTLSNNFVESIYKDKDGFLWVGTQDGLNKFDPGNSTFTRYRHQPDKNETLSKGHTHAIYEDVKGNLWVGTQEGLNKMNKKAGTFTHYVNNPDDTTTLTNNSVTAIIGDRKGNIWVGTSRGLNKMHHRTGKFKHYLPGGISISSLLEDAQGVVWVGALGGLFYYDANTDNFLLFTDPSAGLTATTAVSRIVEDNERNIWGSIARNIFKINSKRTEVSVFGKNNGVTFRNPASSAFKGADGELFFGYETGYFAFSPNRLFRASQPPQIVIADFHISDREVVPGKKSPLQEPLAIAKDIHLKYYQNDFSFDFVGIHFGSPDDNRLFYMLENLDNTWRKAGSEKVAYYYNVPPGHYVFRVKAASSEGIWAEKEINVIIGDRWWLTWWAYAIYALLAALVIWAIAGYRSRSLRQKNKVLEEKVALRTTELKHQKEELQNTLEDLKATQTQLVQKEKMASLGELTAGIAHEIQNPLNFINNFSDLNTEMLDEMKEELQTGNTTEALTLADNIKANNEKITYHGKRADAIVKGMLQHSRRNNGVKELTDINALTDEYLRLSYHGLRAADKSFNAQLQTEFDEGTGKINVIPQDIGRVLLNLFNNAFYAVHQKKAQLNGSYEPVVSVRTRRLPNKIEICIRDNGSGISQKAMDKIFQPFFTTKPSGQGTGLGLSLSYDIITKGHGGEMRVDTKEGEYAEFTILLPA